MTESKFISDISLDNFQQEVIQTSMGKPVLVDFWADWCNPCKILMPILSKLAIEYNGDFHLGKVDTEREKQLSADFGIRSLPTIKLFKQGEVVDEFTGAQPESKIRDFISKHIFKESDFILQEAMQDFSAGNIVDAREKVDNILDAEKHNTKAIILSIKLSLAESQPEQAEALLKTVTIDMSDAPDIKELEHLIAFSKDLKDAPDIETLKFTDSITAHYQLACHYALNEQYEDALKLFIEILEKDRSFKNGGARQHMIAIFDLLGSSGPLVNIYRIKLSRLLN